MVIGFQAEMLSKASLPKPHADLELGVSIRGQSLDELEGQPVATSLEAHREICIPQKSAAAQPFLEAVQRLCTLRFQQLPPTFEATEDDS